MSAFVGPIHHIMYDRILLQDQMTETLLTLGEETGDSLSLRAEADATYPAAAKVNLEEVVDPTDIHGWLTGAVELSERRFALVAGSLLAGNPALIRQAKERLKALGKTTELALEGEVQNAYRTFSHKLLDGMPCDFPFTMGEPTEDEVHWSIKNCPHSVFWQEENADLYYDLREAFVEGMLADSPYYYKQEANTFRFARRS